MSKLDIKVKKRADRSFKRNSAVVRSMARVEQLEQRQLLTATWTALTNTAPVGIEAMVLLPNGDVMGQNYGNNGWALLTPSSTGSYVNGTWSWLSTAVDSRTYYSTQVLENGSVYIAGGEYGSGGANGAVYNPLTNTWTAIPTGVGSYIDADSEILANGDVLEAPVYPASSGQTYLYNPTTNAWTTGPKLYRGSDADEQNWVKLADGSILANDGRYTSERYIPATNTWINDATTTIAQTDSEGEFGTGVLLPNGDAFFVGTGNTTEIYTPSGTTAPGSYTAGPTLPSGLGQDDAPEAVLPDGNVLFSVGPADSYSGPTSFYIYNTATNTVALSPSAPTETDSPYFNRFLDLPDGTVLMSVDGSTLYDYNDGGTTLTAPTPTITGIAHNTDGSYLLTGTQLNGNSEGAYYGDDAQMNSNYPIVRLTGSTGTVYFARTYNWSSDGVDTGSTPVTTNFTLPLGLPAGTYTVNVMVNGFISAGTSLTTPATVGDAAPTIATAAAATPSPVTGLTTNLSVLGADDGGESNLTYTWLNTSAPSGDSTASFSINGTNAAKNTTVTFQQAGTYKFTVTITDSAGLSVTSATVSVVVGQTLTSIVVTPATPSLTAGQTQQLSAVADDQFGNTMSTQPTFTWTLTSGGGTLSSTGLYTTPATGTLAVATATTGTLSASDSIYVVSAPWISTDIGSPGVAGTAFDTNGTFNVSGSGLDVYNTADHFHYVYRTLGGNGEITLRVASEPNPITAWEKAGVMIRATLDDASQQADISVTPGNGIAFQYRTTAGGSSSNVNGGTETAPYWVRLVRSGSTFTGYYSANGITWTKEGSATITMTGSVYVGMFITSQSDTAASTVTFDNVSLLDAASDAFTVTAGNAATVNVLTNDVGPAGSTLTVTGVTQGTKGTVTFNSSGGVIYTASATAVGQDTFTYTISDGLGDTATATETVNILGLQAYYHLNEGTGTTTADATGDGYTATLSGATWTTSGLEGSDGLAFSGTGEFATIPALNLNSNTVTLSGWINISKAQVSSAGILFERDGNNGNGLNFYNTTALGYTWGTNASTYNFNSGLKPTIGTWTFVALVITPSNATIYMEPMGGSLTSATQTLSLPAEAFSSVMGIGEDPTYTSRDFAGSMDELRVYDTSLTSAQIAAIASLNPTVANAPAASPSPVTGTTAALSVLGADYAGESALTYTWSATTLPSGANAPTFSVNGTNAAKATTVTFSKAGNYVFSVKIADAYALSTISTVAVTVNQTLTSITLNPTGVTLAESTTQQFAATAFDQFSTALSTQPTFTWSLASGIGSISAAGLYTAPSSSGNATVQATSGTISGTASVAVQFVGPTVTVAAAANPSPANGTTTALSVLGSEPSGESNLTYTWSLTSLPYGATVPRFNINGTNAAKNTTATFFLAGAYTFLVTVTDTQGSGSTTASVNVTVNQALTSIALSKPGVTTGAATHAVADDQFGNVMATAPTWSATGGTISSAGVFTAGSAGGSFTITATSGSSVSTTVTVVPTTYAGASGSDTYAIRLSPTDATMEQIFVNTPETGSPTYTIPIALVSNLTFTPASDGSVTLDYSNGNPVPSAGISYSSGNSLFIEGATAGGLGFTINATQIINTAATTSPIAYSGLQTVEFDLVGGSNTLTQQAQPAASVTYNTGPGNNTLNISAGSYTFNNDPALGRGSLTVNDNAAVIFAAAPSGGGYATRNLQALNISSSGTATVTASATTADRIVLETSQLTIATGGKLDLGNNAMVVHGGDANAIGNLIKAGLTGNGIVSSTARSDTTHLTTIGVISNNNSGNPYFTTFDNQTISATDVLIRYTYVGDVNLDGKVDGSDYSRIDSAALTGATGWFNGDVNYDGVINGSDYTLMDNAFNTEGAQLPTAPPPTAAVPAPSAYYKFNDGVSTAVADSSGNSDTAANRGATLTIGVDDTTGLAFNGTSSYVSAPAPNITTNTLTVSGWIETTGTETSGAGIIFDRTSASGDGLIMEAGNRLGYSWGSSGSTVNFNSNLIVPANKWTFVALVVSAKNATLYMQPQNGVLSSATRNIANPAESLSSTIDVGQDSKGSKFFKGAMDEVRIYSSALTLSSILTIADLAPAIVSAASSTPSADISYQTALAVQATSQAGDANLIYTWSVLSAPENSTVTFSTNGTSSSYSTTATGTVAGTYMYEVTVTDPAHLSITSSVSERFDVNPFDIAEINYPPATPGKGVQPLQLGNFVVDSRTPDDFNSNDNAADRWVLIFNSLTIVGPYSQLDLGNNDMIIHSTTATAAQQTLAQITAYVDSGYGQGGASNWTYGGIVSGLAAASGAGRSAISVMSNMGSNGKAIYSTFDGQAVTATDVLVKYNG